MSLVYEILNQFGFRELFVEREEIARELCLNNNNLSYRPIFVAEDYGSAVMELKRTTKKDTLF